jgi:hypothetical protein
MSTAMIAITTNSSMSVKPRLFVIYQAFQKTEQNRGPVCFS